MAINLQAWLRSRTWVYQEQIQPMVRTGFEFGASRLQAQCSHCLAMSYPCITCVQTPLPLGKIREVTLLQFFLRGRGICTQAILCRTPYLYWLLPSLGSLVCYAIIPKNAIVLVSVGKNKLNSVDVIPFFSFIVQVAK